ncbi:transcriptional regulator [Listeria weihenstephanensis FSL R9-0317]|uniref:TetR family transcriptional regulator n=1 Tax=Listeria weihenstephanensis TaxID=1006155 RepID=A0A1S7FYF0_9LIST|nr:TetR/AcrR family transcriptional regulator [Listeria weihenstephanensis]AQY52448.1 TetR family transcriptional regulator [Listeria weihenstephanensis]EUJ40868.1 transcriptional regulator [Listeria weihenstephanensis FSL R9-0317]MBC1500776.1 TetR/AcrR family transcriptional regulator [Listeria weihenstephanensis]
MENQKPDRRIKKTKAAFSHALLTLLDEKDFKKITVTDIVTRADVNRGTFYKHYQAKEDLLDEIISDVLADLEIAYQDPYLKTEHFSVETLTPTMVKIFDHVYAYPLFYKQAINEKLRIGFQNQLCDVIKRIALRDLVFDGGNADPELFASYQSHAIFGLIVYWVQHDFADSPAYMSEQLLYILRADTSIPK